MIDRTAWACSQLRVPIRAIVDEALGVLSGEFEALYSHLGRPSIPPERLLRALLLQAFYSVRSERLLMEQLDYNLLFRWFVGLGIDDPVWHPTAFTTNRDRLLDGAVAAKFLAAVLNQARLRQLLSREHFSVDGPLIQAWASMRSFRRKDGADQPPGGGRNGERGFHGERRRNDTHASTTDAEARLFRKGAGKEARLCFMGHLLMENRSGLVVAARLTQAAGLAEREAASRVIESVPGRHRITVGADRAYNTAGFVVGLRELNATPHVWLL
jgi:transposase